MYSKNYGKTQADVIYKLRFSNAVLFLRYLYHVEGGQWRLFDFSLKTETDYPFPKDWPHIYPQ